MRTVDTVILWLASYPRSGNTFLRIVLNRLSGWSSSTVYPVDGVADRIGRAYGGFAREPADLHRFRPSSDVHLVKTHRRHDADVDAGDAVIHLVRDGRDALVSFARQRSEAEPSTFRDHLRELIHRHSGGTGSWGDNALSWLGAPNEARVLLRYEDLVEHPVEVVTTALRRLAEAQAELSVELRSATAPGFAELHARDPQFFRRGRTGTHRDELPADLERLFWSYPDNAEAADRLGYVR